MIGNRPNTAPCTTPDNAWSTGIPYTARATTRLASRPARAATYALVRTTPSSTNTVRRGIVATRADQPSEPATGESCWVNIGPPCAVARHQPSGTLVGDHKTRTTNGRSNRQADPPQSVGL